MNFLKKKKNPCKNKIQYDINFTLYLDSLPLIMKLYQYSTLPLKMMLDLIIH